MTPPSHAAGGAPPLRHMLRPQVLHQPFNPAREAALEWIHQVNGILGILIAYAKGLINVVHQGTKAALRGRRLMRTEMCIM